MVPTLPTGTNTVSPRAFGVNRSGMQWCKQPTSLHVTAPQPSATVSRRGVPNPEPSVAVPFEGDRGGRNVPKPVELVPYSAEWPVLAERELGRLAHALGGLVVAGHHIGSTAVPGIHAKPVIDLLLVVRGVAELDAHQSVFRHLGYRCRGENGIAGRRYYTLDDVTGRRRFQVHCFAPESGEIERHLAFRDYLRTQPETALAYEAEKLRCRELHPHDSTAYCEAKAGWIAGVLPLALAHFTGRSVVDDNSSANGQGGFNSDTGG